MTQTPPQPNQPDPHAQDPHAQEEYQVRFDWGPAGMRSITPGADVIVIVDVLSDDEAAWPEPLLAAVPLGRRAVLSAGLTNRRAVARWIRARQAEVPGRFTVAIVAAGEPAGTEADAGVRFRVGDHLAAGALVDALADTGIDFHSPEAAVAAASFTALGSGLRQLVRASAAGRALIARGGLERVEQATRLDSSELVPVLAESTDGS